MNASSLLLWRATTTLSSSSTTCRTMRLLVGMPWRSCSGVVMLGGKNTKQAASTTTQCLQRYMSTTATTIEYTPTLPQQSSPWTWKSSTLGWSNNNNNNNNMIAALFHRATTTTTAAAAAIILVDTSTLITTMLRDIINFPSTLFISTLKRRRKMMNKHKLRKRRKKNRMKSKK
jgi:Mitochondrial domain of unknown function (DUF1713)